MGFAECSALFGPAGCDINGISGKDVEAIDRGTTMGDGIGFKVSGFGLVPLIGFDGDMMFEQETGFCGGSAFALVETSNGFKDTIDGGGRNSGQFFKDLERQRSEFKLIGYDPDRDNGLKAF